MVKSSFNASFRSRLLRGLSALVLMVIPLSVDLMAQSSRSSRTVMVEGRVTDSQTGEPIPGAAVMLKATNTGVTTDIDGVFMLGINDPKAVLVVSSLGYDQKELPVDGRNKIDIALDPDVESLEDVVVVGYGTQKKATVSLYGRADHSGESHIHVTCEYPCRFDAWYDYPPDKRRAGI